MKTSIAARAGTMNERSCRVCALANAGYLSRRECAGAGHPQACGRYVRQRTYKARHVSVAYVELVEGRICSGTSG